MAQQIKKKFISPDSIDGSKILLGLNEAIRILDSNGTPIELIKIQNGKVFLKGEEAVLKSQLDQVILDYQAAVAAGLSEAKSYADQKIEIEKLRAMAAEAAILLEAKQYADEKAAAEKSRAEAIEADLYAELASKISSTEKGAANGVVPLGADGKIAEQYLPAISISDVHVVNTIAERDALTVESGDVVKVVQGTLAGDGATWLTRTFIFNGTSYIDISSEGDVDSVNGKTGHVTLDTSDIAEVGDFRYFTASREQELKDYADAAVLVEKTRAEAAELQLQANIDQTQANVVSVETEVMGLEQRVIALESTPTVPTFKKEKIVVGASLAHIDLAFTAVADSLVVCVDRLNLQLDDDYSVSVVNGKTRLTWVNDYAVGAAQGVESDDVIYVTYCVQP